MKGLFLRLDPELEAQFTYVCEREGYKKGGLITKWVRDFVAQHRLTDPITEAEAYGIDLSLLRSNLKQSPTERLRAHSQAADFVDRLRCAKHTRQIKNKIYDAPDDAK